MEQNLDTSHFFQELNLLILSLVVSTFAALDSFQVRIEPAQILTQNEKKPLILKHTPRVVPLQTQLRGRM